MNKIKTSRMKERGNLNTTQGQFSANKNIFKNLEIYENIRYTNRSEKSGLFAKRYLVTETACYSCAIDKTAFFIDIHRWNVEITTMFSSHRTQTRSSTWPVRKHIFRMHRDTRMEMRIVCRVNARTSRRKSRDGFSFFLSLL